MEVARSKGTNVSLPAWAMVSMGIVPKWNIRGGPAIV